MTVNERITNLEIQILQAESRIENFVITNPKTLKIAQRNVKAWKKELEELRNGKTL